MYNLSNTLAAGDIICCAHRGYVGWKIRRICKSDHDHESQVYSDERGRLRVLHVASPVNRSYELTAYIAMMQRRGVSYYVIRPRFLTWCAVHVKARYAHEFSDYCVEQVGRDYPESDLFRIWDKYRLVWLCKLLNMVEPNPAPYCIEASVQAGAQTRERFVPRSCRGVELVDPHHIQAAVKHGDYVVVRNCMRGDW